MAAVEYREDPDGTMRPFQAPKQACDGCGKKLKPIFKCTPDPEDWIWRECDTCLEYFCKDCSIENEDGTVECDLCYQTRAIRRTKETTE